MLLTLFANWLRSSIKSVSHIFSVKNSTQHLFYWCRDWGVTYVTLHITVEASRKFLKIFRINHIFTKCCYSNLTSHILYLGTYCYFFLQKSKMTLKDVAYVTPFFWRMEKIYKSTTAYLYFAAMICWGLYKHLRPKITFPMNKCDVSYKLSHTSRSHTSHSKIYFCNYTAWCNLLNLFLYLTSTHLQWSIFWWKWHEKISKIQPVTSIFRNENTQNRIFMIIFIIFRDKFYINF